MTTPPAPMSTRRVIASDGLSLALYEEGDPALQTVICVHGYPDNHTVWDGVVPLLAERFHVVTYDVRGTGASDQPGSRAGYRISQLNADLAAVIEAVSPDRPIHLIGHDWGSIQSWGALTDRSFDDLLLSFTSISGPSLDFGAVWLRRGFAHPTAWARQLLDSYYIFAFQLPALPEATVRRGILDAAVTRSSRIGVPPGERRPFARRPERDAINGIELYRANLSGRLLNPRPGRAVKPVQVLAPLDDAHVTVDLATGSPAPYVDDLRTRTIPGNHWVVEQDPALIVSCFTEFIDSLDPTQRET